MENNFYEAQAPQYNNQAPEAPKTGLKKAAKGLMITAIIVAILGIAAIVGVGVVLPKMNKPTIPESSGESKANSRVLKVGDNSVRFMKDRPFCFTPDENGAYIFEITVDAEYETFVYINSDEDDEYYDESTIASWAIDDDMECTARVYAGLTSGTKYTVKITPFIDYGDDYDYDYEYVERLNSPVTIKVIKAPEITSDSQTLKYSDSNIYSYYITEAGYYSFESTECDTSLETEYTYTSYYDYTYTAVEYYEAGDVVAFEIYGDSTKINVKKVSENYYNAFQKFIEYADDDDLYVTSSTDIYYTPAVSSDSESYRSSGYHQAYGFYYDETNDVIWFGLQANSGSKGYILLWYKYN